MKCWRLLREYMVLHSIYPLHLTSEGIHTLVLPRASPKGVMTQGEPNLCRDSLCGTGVKLWKSKFRRFLNLEFESKISIGSNFSVQSRDKNQKRCSNIVNCNFFLSPFTLFLKKKNRPSLPFQFAVSTPGRVYDDCTRLLSCMRIVQLVFWPENYLRNLRSFVSCELHARPILRDL
jgi:hypothetical protein